jgi:hypothetical protein
MCEPINGRRTIQDNRPANKKERRCRNDKTQKKQLVLNVGGLRVKLQCVHDKQPAASINHVSQNEECRVAIRIYLAHLPI